MNTRFGKVLAVSVATGLFALATHAFGQSYLDGSSKMRGDYGQSGARSSFNGGSYYYRAPVIARQQTAPSAVAAVPAPAPNAVAKAPAKTDTRAFSYQPPASGGCGNATTAPNATAKRDTQTTRSFSYEPGYSSGSMGSSGSSSQPLWALPKSDSRKFGGR